MAKSPEAEGEPDHKRDDVLRRMLKTPPKPHKPKRTEEELKQERDYLRSRPDQREIKKKPGK